jgi:hypothetical protein
MFRRALWLGPALFLIAAAPCGQAQSQSQSAPTTARAASGSRARKMSATGTDVAASTSSTTWEIYKNITVAAQTAVTLDSKLDFTAHDKVAFSARDHTAMSVATSMDALDFQAHWRFDDADYDAVVEHIAGTKFAYWDAGGAVFQSYGPRFRLVITNQSTDTDVTLDQVILFIPLSSAQAGSLSSLTLSVKR